MIPLTRPFFGPEEEGAVRETLRSGWVAQGPRVLELEREFARVVGVPHAIATSSCTTALHLAIVAAGVGPGDEVILPAYTFPATANAVLYERAVPVLVDVDPATLNVDVSRVEAALTERTKMVLGVHLFGFPCEITALRDLCDREALFLLEDAACALGTRIEGRMAGSFGDLAAFSFHARKIVTTGEGGMLTTASDELARLLSSLRTHGADRPAELRQAEGLSPAPPRHVRLGYNYRLSDVQAAIGRVQLGRLDGFVHERNEIARRYDEAFRDLPGVRLPPRRPGHLHSYQSYVILLEPDAPLRPDTLMTALARRGVSTRIGTFAVHREPYFRNTPAPVPFLPVSERAARQAVAIPMYNGLAPADQEVVIDAVRSAWTRTSGTPG